MATDEKTVSGAAELRRKAEEKVASQQASTGEVDAKRLLHELQVHQVELEMQNEELQQTLAELGAESKLRRQAEYNRRKIAHCLLESEEVLKKKISAELHDEMGRDLTALGFNLSIMRDQLTNGADKGLRPRINDSSKLINSIRHTTRNIMGSLRPTGLDELDLIAALEHHIDDYSQRSGIAVSFEVGESFPRLAADEEIVLFRIVQESFTNILKHSKARNIDITLREVHKLILLSISDNGTGFTPPLKSDLRSGSGMGLNIMRERAEMIGGSFDLVSILGSGTTVTVQIRGNRNADKSSYCR
jgi:signal transduction histidine kinase